MDRKSDTGSEELCSSDDESRIHHSCTDDYRTDTSSGKEHLKHNHSEIEKRRRDKMNTFINELSAFIPMCNVMNRKLDKLTVLRFTVEHMKSIKGANKSFTPASPIHSMISNEELKHVLLTKADGFLFAVSCDRARILYCSKSVGDILNYTQKELIGQSWFDILHPQDIIKIKEQLSVSDVLQQERLLDAKTMMTSSQPLCSGARRSFFCRMKRGNSNPQTKCDTDGIPSPRKKKVEQKTFRIIYCTGYLKSWPMSNINLDEDGEFDQDNLGCLVFIGRPQSAFEPYSDNKKNSEVRPNEYNSRLSIDGKFQYVDDRATVILGMLPQELIGTSVYEYYHLRDLTYLADIHRKVLQSKDKIQTRPYKFKVSDEKFVTLQSTCFGFQNPFTKEVDCIVSLNKLVNKPEVICSSRPYPFACGKNSSLARQKLSPFVSCTKQFPGLSKGVHAGVSRIGRAIADESIFPGIAAGIAAGSSRCDGAAVPQRFPLRVDVQASSINTSSAACQSPGISQPTTLDATLLYDVIQEQSVEDIQNPGIDGNVETALDFLMSLLETGAGLEPIDINDLPWPL